MSCTPDCCHTPYNILMTRLLRVTTRFISSYLRRQPTDYFLDNYIRSLDFDGV